MAGVKGKSGRTDYSIGGKAGRKKIENKADIPYNGLKFYSQEQKDEFLGMLKELRKKTGKQNCELLIEALKKYKGEE